MPSTGAKHPRFAVFVSNDPSDKQILSKYGRDISFAVLSRWRGRCWSEHGCRGCCSSLAKLWVMTEATPIAVIALPLLNQAFARLIPNKSTPLQNMQISTLSPRRQEEKSTTALGMVRSTAHGMVRSTAHGMVKVRSAFERCYGGRGCSFFSLTLVFVADRAPQPL